MKEEITSMIHQNLTTHKPDQIDLAAIATKKANDYKEGWDKHIQFQNNSVKQAYIDNFRFDMFRLALKCYRDRRKNK